MPKLSLYSTTKNNNYRYIDRVVAEQFTAGGTDIYVHKYLGPTPQPTATSTPGQPAYDQLDPMNIQDLLFLENRDRTYEPNIIRIRSHYNVQNLDFDLSQFGLFLNNDILFLTVHYNDMIDLVGRKLMVGDVLELPHLLDYHPLNDAVPTSLRRYYHITDGNYASEGFSPTWYPHLWRIKCEPLVDSQEFSQILTAPTNTDNFLGPWNATDTYPAGYVVNFGGTNYTALTDVPAGISPPNATYWQPDTAQNLKDILSLYNKNIEINDAALAEAEVYVKKSGYETNNLYILPTYGPESDKADEPANTSALIISTNITGATGTIAMMRSPEYKTASPVLRLSKQAITSIWDMTADMSHDKLTEFLQMSLESIEIPVPVTDTGSGSVEKSYALSVQSLGPVSGPYGTADNTYVTGDQNPDVTGFTGTVNTEINYRADCDPRFQHIVRYTPRTFGYARGYLTGSGHAPNGLPFGAGITFPGSPKLGDYFLRTDYFPQRMFRWDGTLWIRISENVRTKFGLIDGDESQLASFVNNKKTTRLTDGTYVPQQQGLSTILNVNTDA